MHVYDCHSAKQWQLFSYKKNDNVSYGFNVILNEDYINQLSGMLY